MARLTSSYSVAMEAVGALHRVSRRYCELWKERKACRECESRGNAAIVWDVMNDNVSQKEDSEQVEVEKEIIDSEEFVDMPERLEGNRSERGFESISERNEGNDEIDTRMDIDAENQVNTEGGRTYLYNDNGARETDKEKEMENMNDLGKVTVNKSGEDINRLDEKISKTRCAIHRISNAARTAMEQSLLLDPVIQAPILKGNIGSKISHTLLHCNTNSARKTSTASNKATFDAHLVHCIPLDHMTSAYRTIWGSIGYIGTSQTCLTKWNRLSAAHHTVLKQIAYLSLVNYADLLLCGCTCHRSLDNTTVGTLDRGAVKILDALNLFSPLERSIESPLKDGENYASISKRTVQDEKATKSHSTCCLWRNESRERTIRLALACYCDASELDGTDPTLWFKMACAARSLGREVDSASWMSSPILSPMKQELYTKSRIGSYRGLERLALERGMSSLPPSIPPNRTLLKAWREIEEWDEWCDGIDVGNNAFVDARDHAETSLSTTENNDYIELVINLPNYSWLTLGQILLRACRVGAGCGQSSTALSHSWSTNCRNPEDYTFGCPKIVIRISPLFLPYSALGIICKYLGEGSKDIKSLICICSAMASEVSSAFSKVSQELSAQSPVIPLLGEKKVVLEGLTPADEVSNKTEQKIGSNIMNSDESQPNDVSATKSRGNKNAVKSTNRAGNEVTRGRVSSRVLCKMMTSEKRKERQAKQNSVEYCLLAGVLSCTAENPFYELLLNSDVDWDHLPTLEECINYIQGILRKKDSCQYLTKVHQANFMLAPSSLRSFAMKWSKSNSGPRTLLESFLVHISLHSKDIFCDESNENLDTCILECFDLVVISGADHADYLPSWYGKELNQIINGDKDHLFKTLSVNLLNAELRFKRCGPHGVGFASRNFQADTSYLAFCIPKLVDLVAASSNTRISSEVYFIELSVRCYWLASSYYFWRGRDPFVEKSAEELGVEYLENCLECLSHCPSLATPHLDVNVISIDSVSKHRQNIQSSSIVSRARQIFHDIRERVELFDTSRENIDCDILSPLVPLGDELLQRYDVHNKKSSDRIEELLNDFISVHQDSILEAQEKNLPQSDFKTNGCRWGVTRWGCTWNAVPSSKAGNILNIETKEVSRPSILRVLMTSLLASGGKGPSVFSIYSHMVMKALEMWARASKENIKNSEATMSGNFSTDSNERRSFEKNNHLILSAAFFVDTLINRVTSNTSDDMKGVIHSFVSENVMCNIIYLSFATTWDFKCNPHRPSADFYLLQSISKLVSVIRQSVPPEERKKVESCYFVCLIKLFMQLRKEFSSLLCSASDKRLKSWQSHLSAKADYISHVASEAADLMSLYPSSMNSDGQTSVSHVIKALVGLDQVQIPSSNSCSTTSLAQYSHSLLWFWRICSNALSQENVICARLVAPIASSIIALCGSPGISVECDLAKSILHTNKQETKSSLTFSDYFDSEESVNGTLLSDCDGDMKRSQRKRESLRKCHQLVQCISLVFGSINEKVMCQELSFSSCDFGPLVPLVVVRVLSSISDSIFVLNLGSKGVWCEEYPYGSRKCGEMIDSELSKAYRFLYGFNAQGHNSNFADSLRKSFIPESTTAAAQLFRCIRRMFHNNRRSPPTKALEIIAAALPPTEETKVSKEIRRFLFCPDDDIELIRSSGSDKPLGLPDWVLSQSEPASSQSEHGVDDVDIIRKGVCHELAKGSIMKLDGQHPSSDDQGLSEERERSKSNELSLNKKFCAVLDDLCYNPKHIEGWIILSECLGFKADIICDRLVPLNEPHNSADFILTNDSKRLHPSTLTLEELQDRQIDEFKASREKWLPFIGRNLYVYMQHPWCSFSSLHACAQEIRRRLQQEKPDLEEAPESLEFTFWKKIDNFYTNGQYLSYMNAWAGMFVYALKTMRLRALFVARYLAKSHQIGQQHKMHPSAVSEDLGTALYGDLMGSTVYGYPMHVMTQYEKRNIAHSAKVYFQEAMQLSNSDDFRSECPCNRWDNQFMVGKAFEKIASTFIDETYSEDNSVRSYETNMVSALESYSSALYDANGADSKNVGTDKSRVGGSSHGSTEILYRLHATRLKVIISAIRKSIGERHVAEREAIRIASLHWFDESNRSSPSAGTREKIWDILADIVGALTQCRIIEPLFHRAAYRVAQAFNWAPAFHDPDCDFSVGSMQAVPATKSYKIRGLNSGPCAESSAVVIGSLFEKRRAQLCSVWVTTSTTPPPFEVLNDSVRKYDTLRLKYIKAYIDNMVICSRKDKIDSLLSWAMSSSQDLPSFYESSALVKGGDPGRHSKQALLQGSGFISIVKRYANNALANIILSDLAVMKKNGVELEGEKLLTKDFKLAFILFQRLNSSCEDVVKFMRDRYQIREVAALCKCYISIAAGYRINESINIGEMDNNTLCSLLNAATLKAKQMFQRESKLRAIK